MPKYLFTGLVALLLLVPIAAVRADGDEGPAKTSAAASVAEKEGRYPQAIELLKKLIREWPDDTEFRPEAHLRLVQDLVRAGDLKAAAEWCRETRAHYPGWEELLAKLSRMEAEIAGRAKAAKANREMAEKTKRALANLERDLKAKGLAGEELQKAYEAGKRALLEKIDRQRELDRMKAFASAIGGTAEGIEAAQRRLAVLQAQVAALRKEIDATKAAATTADSRDAEIQRRKRAEVEKARQEEEDRWRAARQEDIEAARRRFVELAQKLGIPGEEAAKFLAEHQSRRSPAADVEGLRRVVEGLARQVAEIGRRLERIERQLKDR